MLYRMVSPRDSLNGKKNNQNPIGPETSHLNLGVLSHPEMTLTLNITHLY